MTVNYQELLISPIDSADTLDKLWLAYKETQNEDFILKIISILDWEDKVRRRMNTWFQEINSEEISRLIPRLIEWVFPMDYENFIIEGPLDLDIHVALLAKEGKLKFNELPVQIPQNELIYLAIKSAAIWSLISLGESDTLIAKVCAEQSKIKGGASRKHLTKFIPSNQISKNNLDIQIKNRSKWWQFWLK